MPLERKKVLFHVPAGSVVEQCKQCPAMMAWRLTATGRMMPMDLPPDAVFTSTMADPTLRTQHAYDGESHWARCPAADEFRDPDYGRGR